MSRVDPRIVASPVTRINAATTAPPRSTKNNGTELNATPGRRAGTPDRAVTSTPANTGQGRPESRCCVSSGADPADDRRRTTWRCRDQTGAGHGTLLESLAVGRCWVLSFERRQERDAERRSKLYSWDQLLSVPYHCTKK